MLRKCCGCKERYDPAGMIKLPGGWFHDIACATSHGQAKAKAARERAMAKQARAVKAEGVAFRKETTRRRQAAKKRTGKNGYYDNLKSDLHRYIKHGLRKGEPCYTCGKEQRHGDAGGAFHVGHYMPAKMVDPRRFMVEQLRIQCFSCNAMNSGRQTIFRENLIKERGIEWVEWLECEANHKSLKERFPDVEDIKRFAAGHRSLLKVYM